MIDDSMFGLKSSLSGRGSSEFRKREIHRKSFDVQADINTLEKEIALVNLTTRLIKSRKTAPKAIDTEGDDSVVKTTGKNRSRV